MDQDAEVDDRDFRLVDGAARHVVIQLSPFFSATAIVPWCRRF